jgi:hypothetical protein
MKRMAVFVSFLSLGLASAAPALGSDQDKAQKEMNKMTAMAADFGGRRVVNLTMSETFNVPRPALVEERTQTGLSYGGLFLMEEIAKAGMKRDDIAAKLTSGTAMSDLLNQQHLDWKQVAQDAKQFNAAIDKNLYNFFMGKKETFAQDEADGYDVHHDGVKADADVSQPEIASAQDRYLLLKSRAEGRHEPQGSSAFGRATAPPPSTCKH